MYLQYETLCTERAAAAIAAVGELARMRRLETHQQGGTSQQQVPQQPQLRPEQQPPPVTYQTNNYNMMGHQQQHQLQQPRTQITYAPPPPPPQTINTQFQSHFQTPPSQPLNNYQNPSQNLPVYRQVYHQNPQQITHPPSHDGAMGNNPGDQQAGIRRGPRKYYLSRSAQYQD